MEALSKLELAAAVVEMMVVAAPGGTATAPFASSTSSTPCRLMWDLLDPAQAVSSDRSVRTRGSGLCQPQLADCLDPEIPRAG